MSEQKQGKESVLLNNTVLKVIALVLAFFAWVVVAMSTKDETTRVIKDVPITINQQSTVLTQQGLTLISTDATVMDVTVSGQRLAVSNVDPVKDLVVSVSLSTVVSAGSYPELRVDVKPADGRNFTVTGQTRKSVSARFDKLIERKFTVEPKVANFVLPEGYMMQDELPQVSPREITLTGPEEELARVAGVSVSIDMESRPINSRTKLTKPIELTDAEGQPLQSKELKQDYETADVTFNVLKTKEVPIRIGYTNVPANFPLDELQALCVLSNTVVRVAGPTDKIDNFNEIYAGYIPLNEITVDSIYTFDLELPTGFENLDSIASVEAAFNTEGMISKQFYVNDLRVINAPADYTVNMITRQLTNVTIVGPRDVVNNLTGKDIIATVDLSDRQITTGQMKLGASIQVPAKGLVWANGSYNVVVDIKEK